MMFSSEYNERYQRQMILPEVGVTGQERLRRSAVLIVGAGGLGSPVAMYLAAAGVGRIGLVDEDKVEASNLHRQILHPERNLNRDKVASAGETLASLNTDTIITQHHAGLTDDNAGKLLHDYDVAVGCVDNFPARYALNRACFSQGKPNVFGSVARFDGQVAVFASPGPCYQCFFQQPPPESYRPSPEDKGILGPVAGIIGCIQATETLKTLLGAGSSLSGRLLLLDALTMTFRQIALKRDPHCPVCGKTP